MLLSGQGPAVSGEVLISSASSGSSGASGVVNIVSGASQLSSGPVVIQTGPSVSGRGGSITLEVGKAGSGKGGNIFLNAGESSSVSGGDLRLVLIFLLISHNFCLFNRLFTDEWSR